MPQDQYNKLPVRKFTEEIILETREVRTKLDALVNAVNSTYAPLLVDMTYRASQFGNTTGMTSLLYPLFKQVLEIERHCALLMNIKTIKQDLLEDTRYRRVLIRTGNLKIWIESQLPETVLENIEKHLSIQFEALVSLLQKIHRELEESPCADSIYTGKKYRWEHIQNPLSKHLLTTLVANEEREESPYNSLEQASALPEPVKKQHRLFLREFSVFKQAADEMYRAEPGMARDAIREFKDEVEIHAHNSAH